MGNLVGYSPWMDAANVGEGIGNKLGSLALQIPHLRLQQQQLALQKQQLLEQAGTHQAQARMYDSEAGLNREKTRGTSIDNEEKVHTNTGLDSMGAGLATMYQKFANGEQPSEAEIKQVTGGVVHMAKNNPDKLAMFVRTLLATQASGMGTNPQAALGVLQPKLVTGQVLPRGGTMVDPMDGTVRAVGTQTMNPGQAVTNPQHFSPGIAAPPMTIAATNPALPQHMNLGNVIAQMLKLDESSDQPFFDQNQRKDLGTAVMQQIKTQKLGNAVPSDKVRVVAPDGKTGSIPQAQVKEALASGYKLIQ